MVKQNNSDPLDIWINSFGGCRSNYVRDLLDGHYKTYNSFYEFKGCHYYKPLPDINPELAIFCYTESVGIALTSQINRGMQHNFFKEIPLNLHEKGFNYSIKNWQGIITSHIENWTKANVRYPILIINTDRLEENREKFKDITGIEVVGFKRGRSTKHTLPSITDLKKAESILKNIPDFMLLQKGKSYEF